MALRIFPPASPTRRTVKETVYNGQQTCVKTHFAWSENASGKPLSIHTSWLTGGNTAVGVKTNRRVTDLFVSEKKKKKKADVTGAEMQKCHRNTEACNIRRKK